MPGAWPGLLSQEPHDDRLASTGRSSHRVVVMISNP